MAEAAGLGGARYIGDQRRASSYLAERRPGPTLRSVSAAGLARTIFGFENLGPGGGHPHPGTVGGASAAETEPGDLCSRKSGNGGVGAQSIGGGAAAPGGCA